MTRSRGGSRRVRPTVRSNPSGRSVLALLAVLWLLVTPGCFTMEHTVGAGPAQGHELKTQQWFAGWGLIPIYPVSSEFLAGGAADYRVTTQFTFADTVISMITSFVGFYRQTVVVER